MKHFPVPGDRVHINFHNETLPGIIVSDLSGTMFSNPGTVYVVKLIRNGRIFVKPISIYHLSERTGTCATDTRLQTLPKLKRSEKGYSEHREHPCFYQKYSVISRCRDGINRRKLKPRSVA